MNDKSIRDMSFDELLLSTAEEQKENLAWSMIQNAQKGDASAIKILQVAMERALYSQENKLRINDEQIKRIIKLCAERLTP